MQFRYAATILKESSAFDETVYHKRKYQICSESELRNMKDTHISVGLFMTLGIGLRNWERVGSLNRELEIYHRFLKNGWGVTIFTYDCANNVPRLSSEFEIKTLIPRFLPNRLFWLYALLMPILFYRDGKKISVLKTNQAHSGWPALWCGKLWGKKVIARCGYVFGESAESLNLSGIGISKKKLLEKITFKYADVCFVPTAHLKNWIIKNYKIDEQKIQIIPNHVDVELFKPVKMYHSNSTKNILSVGRLCEVKRFGLLIDALEGENLTLTLIGNGSFRENLRTRSIEKKVSLKLVGNILNQEIPTYLSMSDIFVICSTREGHPKALIEAMACGCACVGTDSPGIREIIAHGENGLICDSSPTSIKDAIKTLLSDNVLRMKVQKNARLYANRHFSSTRLIEKEMELVKAINN